MLKVKSPTASTTVLGKWLAVSNPLGSKSCYLTHGDTGVPFGTTVFIALSAFVRQ
jgi:hypothetical protein